MPQCGNYYFYRYKNAIYVSVLLLYVKPLGIPFYLPGVFFLPGPPIPWA